MGCFGISFFDTDSDCDSDSDSIFAPPESKSTPEDGILPRPRIAAEAL
jgi:hypothetical protein